MNISTNTNHIHGTGIGFRRNGTARALLAMAITATTVLVVLPGFLAFIDFILSETTAVPRNRVQDVFTKSPWASGLRIWHFSSARMARKAFRTLGSNCFPSPSARICMTRAMGMPER